MTGNASVVVCTYNAPDRLDLVLAALARQDRLPEEILVADDGSDDRTAERIARHASSSRVPIRHLWHRDSGVRRAAIVNAAVAVARGDLLAFLDGDCVPDRYWLADHLAHSDGVSVLCGRRLRLGCEWSRRLSRDLLAAGATDAPWRGFLFNGFLRGQVTRYHLAFRLPQRLVRGLVGDLKPLMGCNFSAPRSALERVDGYDAAWEGARHLSDDFDLDVRLGLAGVGRVPLLHAANVFHLHHSQRPETAEVLALRSDRRRITDVRAVDGIQRARERIAVGEVEQRL